MTSIVDRFGVECHGEVNPAPERGRATTRLFEQAGCVATFELAAEPC
jgi:hypothetical protein